MMPTISTGLPHSEWMVMATSCSFWQSLLMSVTILPVVCFCTAALSSLRHFRYTAAISALRIWVPIFRSWNIWWLSVWALRSGAAMRPSAYR